MLQNISLNRSNIKIFEDVNLSLGNGKIIVLKGKNGSGKTSLIKNDSKFIRTNIRFSLLEREIIKKNLYDFYNNITYIVIK